MKKTIFFLATILTTSLIFSQNTFPTSGNAGIGTTVPTQKLEVNSGNIYINTPYVNSGFGRMQFKNTNAFKTWAWMPGVPANTEEGFGLRNETDSTNPLWITNAGNIGIGTVTPVGKVNIITGISGLSFNILSQALGSVSFGNNSTANTAPTITGKSNNSMGLSFISGTNDTNGFPDMVFDARENDNTDYTTLTSAAFRLSRFGTPLIDILRNGRTTINTASSGTLIDALTLTNSGLAVGTEVGLFFSATQATGNIRGARISAINDGSNNISLKFYTGGASITEKMRINEVGNIGIGTTIPDSKLTVNGTIHATEVKVTSSVTPDYVFEKYYLGQSSLKPDYTLLTLSEVERFTEENHHLPNVPSAKEIKENGLLLGEMSNILLQKIEELTLYSIEQQKTIEKLEKENQAFKSIAERLSKIEKELETKK